MEEELAQNQMDKAPGFFDSSIINNNNDNISKSASSSLHHRSCIYRDASSGLDDLQDATAQKYDNLSSTTTKPINICREGRKRFPSLFHTPLSARGDLTGGYFPFHEPSQSSLETHPFNRPSSAITPDYHFKMRTESPLCTPIIMEPSQYSSSLTHQQVSPSPVDFHFSTMDRQTPQTPPLVSMPPLGKYHPANYQNKSPSITLRPPLRHANSSLSFARPKFERSKSDNKKLLQNYQRDMVQQAARQARSAGGIVENPTRAPKLAPLCSPGPVTPMDLEDTTTAGYLVAGARRQSIYRQGEHSKGADMVEKMIRSEEKRRRREGQIASLATAGGH